MLQCSLIEAAVVARFGLTWRATLGRDARGRSLPAGNEDKPRLWTILSNHQAVTSAAPLKWKVPSARLNIEFISRRSKSRPANAMLASLHWREQGLHVFHPSLLSSLYSVPVSYPNCVLQFMNKHALFDIRSSIFLRGVKKKKRNLAKVLEVKLNIEASMKNIISIKVSRFVHFKT